MATLIQNKFDHILGDGARASKFDVNIAFNNDLYNDAEALAFMAKATSFPGKSHDIIDLKYKGRSIPIKGQTKFEQTWECTFYLTQDHVLKNVFETWIESIDQQHNYFYKESIPKLSDTQKGNEGSYVTNMMVYQKNFEGTQDTSTYVLYNAFPTAVSSVTLDAESVGTITEFTVTFAYSHYQSFVVKGPNGNFVDDLVDKFKSGVSSAISEVKSSVSDFFDNGNILDDITKSAKELEKQFTLSIDDMADSIDDWF